MEMPLYISRSGVSLAHYTYYKQSWLRARWISLEACRRYYDVDKLTRVLGKGFPICPSQVPRETSSIRTYIPVIPPSLAWFNSLSAIMITMFNICLCVMQGGGRRECEEAAGCACGGAPPAPPAPLVHHPLRALDQMPPPLLRSNPLYTEEEEQEVVIIVDSLDEVPEGEAPEPPRTPRRAPSTSSGYGSGGGSHGRVSPNLPKSDQFEAPACRLSDSDKNDGSHTTSDSDASPVCTLSRSLKEDIRSCLGVCRWEKDVNEVVEAAVRGAGGISAARARLHAALLALHEPPPRLPQQGPVPALLRPRRQARGCHHDAQEH
ncbi:uncharacterized protein LOC113501325 [Trichoplusia ni]|uniref:Uncharacterized protein LOC113501325 n=1 Tax=Trichoplusia ni TaxID=7111 RepID=A0A7E5WDJ3_TRINI|nr:uncharacterized protein LOC113501325 [Trichoplusia ni]